MVAFLDNLTDDNFMLKVLGEEDKLLENMTNIVEPLFKQYVLDDETNLRVFDEIVADLIEYYYREYSSRLTIAGLIYDILGELGNLKKEDIDNIDWILQKSRFKT